ncbi:SDR family oxidoreductase [Chryseolinea sp. T2]|uniref:SDR family oxidoreductase n=1 Tax=Chryseolinea sp. T2 TaxID=3129255 RepID=UPI0030776BC9
MASLSNKVIWVTGASSGIGEALAIALSRKGARLILSARRTEELDRVKQNCVGEAQLLPLDLTAADTLDDVTRKALSLYGHIDVLINNGGISQRSFVHETGMDVYRRIMEVNFFGGIALTRNLVSHFVSRKQGQFVVISSVTGKYGTPFRSGYAASKHALHGFYDAVRAEYWKDNVRVTMVCPGVVKTAISYSALKGDGSKNNKMDDLQSKGMPVEKCADAIVNAMENERDEVYIGGKEVLMIYIKRFFPSLFSKIIRKVVVR